MLRSTSFAAVLLLVLLACACASRASYQQQYQAAVSAMQSQQASTLADIASFNRYLQDLGLPPPPTQGGQQQQPRPGTPQQQQQQQRGGGNPMQELYSRLQGLRSALEARAAAQRAAQQQLEAQVTTDNLGLCGLGGATNIQDCHAVVVCQGSQ